MASFLIKINLKQYLIDSTIHTLIQRCELLSIMIPRFCFHDKLSIAGNCRMCLVEVNNSPKPVVSCATKVVNGLEIITNSLLIKQIREHIIEFLLINHPLDCPICDQGGECDLQDQTLIYGSDRGRFREKKRSVLDKNFGPFIKTVMTRCIHCTKCVRFIEEYGDNILIGTLGRGNDTEIGLYNSNSIIYSELSGNIVDLCPVGALTSKPYAFKSRSWELIGTESLDIFDSLCSNIIIQTRGNDILRILPRKNNLINENWITDQIRFGYDAFKKQRILVPFVKSNLTCKIIPINWKSAISFFLSNFLKVLNNSFFFSNNISFFLSNLLDLETLYVLNKFSLYKNIPIFNTVNWVNVNKRSRYLINKSINDVEFLNFTLLLGLDLKIELPILNLKLKKSKHTKLSSRVKNIIYYIGVTTNNNIGFKHLGFSVRTTIAVLYSKVSLSILMKAQIRNSFFSRANLYSFSFLKWYFPRSLLTISYNPVWLNVGNIHMSELNTQPSTYYLLNDFKKKISIFNYFIGADGFSELPLLNNSIFTVFQGSHFNETTIGYNLFLPSSLFIEGGIRSYLNLEGRIQRTFPVITNPSLAVKDVNIVKVLMTSLKLVILTSNSSIPYRHYNSIKWFLPFINNININQNYSFQFNNNNTSIWFENLTYFPTIKQFYGNNIYSKNSIVLNKMLLYKNKNNNFFNL